MLPLREHPAKSL